MDGVGLPRTIVRAFLPLPRLPLVEHLVTGYNAPEVPSAEMDAAVAHILVECLNAPLLAVASTHLFVGLDEQSLHIALICNRTSPQLSAPIGDYIEPRH